MQPVQPLDQQRWVWNGIAGGADTVLFWCWRDEVFGREAGGYGLIGTDGLAEGRIAAMQVTGRVLEEHRDLLDAYEPATPEVGVLFSPQAYYLCWAQDGNASKAANALQGYCRALSRQSVPYLVVEEEHLDALEGLKILFLPRALVLGDDTVRALEAFAERGGTLVVESECGAFTPEGVYRYADERPFVGLTGVREIGRRTLTSDTVDCDLEGVAVSLGLAQWTTPYDAGQARVLASCVDGPLVVEAPAGKGRIVCCGSYPGEAYCKSFHPGFEALVKWAVQSAAQHGGHPSAGGADVSPATPSTEAWPTMMGPVEIVSPQPDAGSFLYVKHGSSRGRRILFVFFDERHESAELRFPADFFGAPSVTDLISKTRYTTVADDQGRTALQIGKPEWRFAVLVEGEEV